MFSAYTIPRTCAQHWVLTQHGPHREKCSLSKKDGETSSVNTLRARTEVCTGDCGGKESRRLDSKSQLDKLLIILTAFV